MLREFDYYDDDTITQELDALPPKDAANLIAIMNGYETVGFGNPSPAKIQDYGEGIKSIRHFKPSYKGRGLFYVGESGAGYQKLWILTVYKKESQEVPKHILERAKSRKASHEAKLKAEKAKENNQ
jgi:phage-related protein